MPSGTVLCGALALAITCVLGVVGAPVLVWVMASGLKESGGFDAAVVMTRWMFPYIGFMSLVALSAGILNTWSRFAVPAATPVLLNLCTIGAALFVAPLFRDHGIEPVYALGGGGDGRRRAAVGRAGARLAQDRHGAPHRL
jgi:putative peptidoglycan lipid II flippase